MIAMKKLIIKKLREHASVPGKEKTWIAGLNDAQLFEIFSRFGNGESSKSIAFTVKEVWKIHPTTSTHSLSQGLLKYRKRISDLLTPPSISRNQSFSLPPSTTIQEETVGESLEEIGRQQEDRIKRIMAEERQTGTKYPYLNKEIQALAALRKTILKQREHDLKNGPAIRRIKNQRTEKVLIKNLDKVLKNFGDIDGDRLLSAAQRFLELAAENSFIMEKDPD